MLNWQKYDEMMFDEELTKDDMGELSKIFNGEIGEIVGFSNSNDDNEVAMKVLINEEIIMFTKNDIDNLLLGYCTTIYKFQGSQIPYPIILTLDTHRGQLNKKLLYTNLSRGQKKVTEIGDVSAVQYSLGTLASINKKNNIASILVNIQKEDKIDDGRTEEVN